MGKRAVVPGVKLVVVSHSAGWTVLGSPVPGF